MYVTQCVLDLYRFFFSWLCYAISFVHSYEFVTRATLCDSLTIGENRKCERKGVKEISISRNRSLYPIRIIRSGFPLTYHELNWIPLRINSYAWWWSRIELVSELSPSFYFFFRLRLAIEYNDIFNYNGYSRRMKNLSLRARGWPT